MDSPLNSTSVQNTGGGGGLKLEYFVDIVYVLHQMINVCILTISRNQTGMGSEDVQVFKGNGIILVPEGMKERLISTILRSPSGA